MTWEEGQARKSGLNRITYKIGEELIADVAMNLLKLLQVTMSPLHTQVPHAHGSHHFHTC
jgi:hypothetical protein